MIYTITFNPAIDYICELKNFEIGKINRIEKEELLPGGKGLNVSIVLKKLGIESVAIGYIAGFTGEELEKRMEFEKIQTDFIKVKKGITRINVKISSIIQEKDKIVNIETALNGNGPEIEKNDVTNLIDKIKQIKGNHLVIISGNAPKCINDDIYEIICKELQKNNVNFIIDATQKFLTNTLKYKPFLIKPNRQEIEEIFEEKVESKEDIIKNAKKLQKQGAQNVLVSIGGDGAILVTAEQEIYYANAPKGEVITTVGAGDSMVAGFVAGYTQNKDYKYALKMGISAGSASAFSNELATKQDIENLLSKIEIKDYRLT